MGTVRDHYGRGFDQHSRFLLGIHDNTCAGAYIAWGIVVALGLMRQPNIGFILIFLGGMFAPFLGPSGLNAAVLMAAVVMPGVWILDMLVIKCQFILIRSAVILPIMVFLAISVLSFVMGQIPWFVFARQAPLDAQAGGFAIFVFSIGVMLSAAHLNKDIRWLEIIVWVFIGLGAFYVLGRAVSIQYIVRLYQSGFTAGSMFWTWLVALAFSQVLYNDKLRPRARGLLVAVVLLTFYVAIVQGMIGNRDGYPRLWLCLFFWEFAFKELWYLQFHL